VITSTKNQLTDFWVMDGVVVEPDLEALQILRHDLRTGERVVLARLAPDALAEEKKKGVEYESVYSVMIGGREQPSPDTLAAHYISLTWHVVYNLRTQREHKESNEARGREELDFCKVAFAGRNTGWVTAQMRYKLA